MKTIAISIYSAATPNGPYATRWHALVADGDKRHWIFDDPRMIPIHSGKSQEPLKGYALASVARVLRRKGYPVRTVGPRGIPETLQEFCYREGYELIVNI